MSNDFDDFKSRYFCKLRHRRKQLFANPLNRFRLFPIKARLEG